MAAGDKVLAHPDCNEIMERLAAGDSVDNVETWLRSRYPTNKNRWISYLTLQRFRQTHMNLKGQVLAEIKSEAHKISASKVEEQKHNAVVNSSAYETAKLTVAQGILNQNNLMLELHDKIWDRIRLMEAQEVNYKNDAVIVEYLSQLRQLMMDHHKVIMDNNKVAAKNEGPTNVQVVIQEAQEQITTLKRIVLEILSEMDPSLIPKFLEKVRTQMQAAVPTNASASGTTVNVQVNHGS